MQELRICTDSDRRRGILIYRILGLRDPLLVQFSSAEHKIWIAHCAAPRRSVRTKFCVQQTKIAEPAGRAVPNLRYIRIPRRLSESVQIRSSVS